MTGNDVLLLALSLLGEEHAMAAEYEESAASSLQILFGECRMINEALRRMRGKEIPVAWSSESFFHEIPMEEELLVGVLPYGLAARLALEEGDEAKVNYLEALYREARMQAYPAAEKAIGEWCGEAAQ